MLALLFRPIAGEFLLDRLDLRVVIVPFGYDAHGSIQFRLFRLRIVAQIDCLGLALRRVVAPSLAPQPFLR